MGARRPRCLSCLTNSRIATYLKSEATTSTGWSFADAMQNSTSLTISYRNGSGGRLSVTVNAGTGYHRVGLMMTSGTSGRVNTYGDKLIRAWGIGSKDHALGYGTQAAVDALWRFSDGAGGAGWRRAYTEATADGVTAYYTMESATVYLHIDAAAAAAGKLQAVTSAETASAGC